jgi:hypothetical protein
MALEFTDLRVLSQVAAGGAPGAESSLLKIKGTEIQQAGADAAMMVAAHYQGVLPTDLDPEVLGHDFGIQARRSLHVRTRRNHVWRVERDPEEHYRQGRARPLGSPRRQEKTDEFRFFRRAGHAARQRRALCAGRLRLGRAARHRRLDAGMSRENWQTFAELGWLSVPFAEEHGGFGGGPVDVMVMMEEFGKGLVLSSPTLPRWCCSAGCCAPRAVRSQQAQLIPGIIDGSTSRRLCLPRTPEPLRAGRHRDPGDGDGDGYVLSGEKVVVSNGANADTLIVAARTAASSAIDHGISLFLVPVDAAGVERSATA